MNREGLLEEARIGVAWSGVHRAGGQFVSLLVFLILSRLLSPGLFGLWAMAGVFTAFISIFVDQGMGDALVQREHLDRSHLDTTFWLMTGLGCALTLLSQAAAPLVAEFFHEPQVELLVRWLACSFLFTGFAGVPIAILRRELRFRSLAVATLSSEIVAGLMAVGTALAGYGAMSLIVMTLGGVALQSILLWGASRYRPRFAFSLLRARELYAFGLAILADQVLNFLNRHADDLLIGRYLGATQLGYYSIAYRVLLVMTNLLVGTVNSVAFPVFARLQTDLDRMRNGFYKATAWTGLVSFPAFCGLALVAPEAVRVFLGPAWTPALPVMQILSFIGIIHSVSFFVSSVLLATGRSFARLALTALNATANVVAFFLVVQWGIAAVAAAYVLRGYVLFPIAIVVLHKAVGLDLGRYLGLFRAPVLGSLMMGAAVCILRLMHPVLSPSVLLLVLVLVGASTYAATVRLLDPALAQEALGLVRSFLPHAKARKESGS